jgi:hypothetical protein
MSNPRITLSDRQMDHGFAVACIRRGTACLNGLKHTNGWKPSFAEALFTDRVAACAELAAKIWLNPASPSGKVEWDRYGIGKPDLADFVDVKAVENPYHCLIVQKAARNAWAYLLVDATDEPTFEIVGWMWGRDAKRDDWWKPRVVDGEDRSAYFVKREHLFPLDSLYEEVRKREFIRGQTAIAK